MTMWLLTNSGGDYATALVTGAEASPVFNLVDIITGPRSTKYRTLAATGDSTTGYEYPIDRVMTHVVIARADWMLTKDTSRIRFRQRNSSAAWSTISGVDYNPATVANLVGPTSQDLAVAIAPTVHRGTAMMRSNISGTAEATQISKFYASAGLSMGQNPQMGVAAWQDLPDGEFAFPARGHRPYEIERRFGLTWEGISYATYNQFLALPCMDRWPLFLFDDAGDVFPWKLEHVIIESWQVDILAANNINLSVQFARLKHWN